MIIPSDLSECDAAQKTVFDRLDALGIRHQTWRHPAVFTVEEGLALDLPGHIPGQHGKSLLVTNKAGKLWLIVARESIRVDLRAVADRLGAGRFSFAKPAVMEETLGVTPGSANPFAVICDTHKRVTVVLDEGFALDQPCVFHPMRNTHSTALLTADLVRFLESWEHAPVRLNLISS